MMKHVLTVLAFSLLLVGWSPPVQAAPEWFQAKVLKTGVTGGDSVLVRLTDLAATPTFTNKWFFVSDLVAKEMLAIALTAIATDMAVQVNTDPFEQSQPEIRVMYLLAP